MKAFSWTFLFCSWLLVMPVSAQTYFPKYQIQPQNEMDSYKLEEIRQHLENIEKQNKKLIEQQEQKQNQDLENEIEQNRYKRELQQENDERMRKYLENSNQILQNYQSPIKK